MVSTLSSNGKLRRQSSTNFIQYVRPFQLWYIILLSFCIGLLASLARFELAKFALAAAATYPPLTMDVRFNRQQTLLEGVIEVQPTVADPWGSICSYTFKGDADQANVVCSQMGFGLSPLTSFLPLGSVTNASSKVWFDEVNCTKALATKVAQYPNGIVPPTVRMNISSCSYIMTPRNDTSPCLHRRDVGVRCVPPTSAWEFKIVNTSVLPTRGLVLMRPTKHLGTDVLPWGTVHNTYFRNNRFAVLALCRSMGFFNTTAPSVQINGESGYATTAPAGTRNGAPAYLTVTNCPSDATYIQNCTGYNFEALTWSNSYQLAVQCDDETDSGRIYGYNIMAQVKLINGFSSSHGQIYVRESTYSSYGWNATTGWRYIPAAMLLYGPPYDSAVTAAQNKAALLMICRAAGFTTATNPAFRFVGARLAINGLSAVDYQRMECISNPKNVTADCKFYKTTATFSGNAAYPSGVDCFPDDTASRKFEYRLINGTTSSNGIVQMRLGPDTAWGTISNPRANDYSLWETVCGALGYKGGINSTFAYRYLYQFTNTTLYQSEANGNLYAPIYLDDVQCPQLPPYMYNASARPRPNLNSIKDNCTYSPLGSSLYPTHRTLALDCDTASADSNSYRTNVSDSSKFRISSNYYGNFVPYLSSNSGYDYYNLCGSDPNSYVAICRMLGFTFANLSTIAIRSYTSSTPQTLTSNGNPLSFGNLSCTYNATTWANCSHDHLQVESCTTGYPSVNCYAIPDISQAEFRLVGGPIASSGRAEMRPTPLHEWGTIRNNGWMTIDRRMTILLCRFLGYTDDTRPRSRAVTAYGQGVGMVYFYYALCSSGIFPECLLNYLGSASQSHSTDLGVDCEGPVVPDISLFEFRGIVAASTATYTYYRVEMREGPGYDWGRIYQSSSTPYLLYLACKAIGQFNFSNNQSTLVTGYRNASLTLKVSNFACSASSATALNECTFDENSYLNSDNSAANYDFVVNCNPSPTMTRQFRLANGTTPMNGRLEHRASSTAVWQSISEYVPSGYSYYWGYFYNVFAACRSLGFPYNYNVSLYGYAHTPVRFVPYNYFGNSTVAAEQTGMGISCTAAFGANLPSCSFYVYSSNFDKMKVIALDCNSTLYSLDKSEYRINKNLTYSTFYYRFEMRPNPSVPWGTIASRYATIDQAFMVKMCEAAGEPMPTKWVATTYSASSVYDYTDLPIYAYRWNCPDGYTHIKQCSTGIEPHETFASTTTFWRTPHYYDTYINCAAYPPGNGSQWTLRLVTGNDTVATNGEGILQIIPWTVISEFGTVCSNSWTLDTTRAACRSVGWGVETLFNATTVAAIQSTASPSLYGGGNVAAYKNITVWYSGVSVPATNYLVQDRAANYVGPVTTSSCLTHASDVALKCNTQLFNVADFEFRGVIVYPGIPSIVRLEMRPNPSQPWGTAYETNRTASNTNVAKAVCRMLGYTGEYATHHTSIMAGSGNVWLPPLTCSNQATHPAQCTFNKTFFQYYTTHSYDVTVNCLTVPLTYPVDVSSFAFRLNNTGNKAQGTLGFGRLEVRPTPYAEWGSVDASGMTNELATAACRSAGFINPDPIDAQFTTNLSPLLVGYQWMYLSDCPDKPYNLGNCSSINWLARTTGSHSNDVWLECYPMVNFRLYGGPSNASGLVQIRMGNFSSNWGLLCSDLFERSREAWRVVCRTIGFPFSVRAHFSQKYIPSGSANTIFLDDLSCPPGSETIPECSYRQLGTSDCNYLYDAASLECIVPTETIVIETRTETETHVLTESRTRPITSSKTKVSTETMTISYTLTPTKSIQPPETRTATATSSATASFSLSPTMTQTVTGTAFSTTTASQSTTLTQTVTGSQSPTATKSRNPTKSRSVKPTDSLSLTSTMSNTVTASFSASGTASHTTTQTQTLSRSAIMTDTVSPNGTLTRVGPPTVSPQPSGSIDPVKTHSVVASRSISGTSSMGPSKSVARPPTLTFIPTVSLQLEATPSLNPNRTVSIVGLPTASHNVTETLGKDKENSRSDIASPSLSVSQSLVANQTDSHEPTMTLSAAPTLIDFNVRIPCQYMFAVALDKAITDVDFRSRNIIVTISLPVFDASTGEDLPFFFRNPDPSSSTFEVPHPTIRLTDNNVGTNEPRGYAMTYGGDGQHPAGPYIWEYSSNTSSSLNGTSADDDPRNDPLLAQKYNGRVFCEVVSPKVIQCVVPRNGAYRLFAEDVLVLSILSSIPNEWVMPRCYTTTARDHFAYIDDGQKKNNNNNNTVTTPPVATTMATVSTTTTTAGPSSIVASNTSESTDANTTLESTTAALPTTTTFPPVDTTTTTTTNSDNGGWTTTSTMNAETTTTETPHSSDIEAAATVTTTAINAISAAARSIMRAMENVADNTSTTDAPAVIPVTTTAAASGGNTARVMYEGVLPGQEVRYLSSTSELRVTFVVDADSPSELGAAINSFGPVAGVVSVLAAIFGGSSAMDVQIVAMLGQSACMGEVDRHSTIILRYFISPLFDVGFAAIAFGNLGVTLLFSAIQYGMAKQFQSSRRIREIDSWAATRFPSFSYACVQLFYVGMCYGAVNMFSGQSPADGVEINSPISFVLGFVMSAVCVCIIFLIGYVALYVVNAKFVQYTQFLSRPWYTRWIYPLGFWEMPAQRLAYGYLLNPYRQGDKLKLFSAAGFVTSLATSTIMLISPIPCEVRLSLVGILFLAVAIMYLVLQPARLPTNSAFSFAGQITMALLVFISATQIISPTVAVMNAKLVILFLQILLVTVRSIFSIAINVLEDVRWSKFRNQNDAFADDSDLLDQHGMGLMDIDDFDELFGEDMAEVEKPKGKKKKSQPLRSDTTPVLINRESSDDFSGELATLDDSDELKSNSSLTSDFSSDLGSSGTLSDGSGGKASSASIGTETSSKKTGRAAADDDTDAESDSGSDLSNDSDSVADSRNSSSQRAGGHTSGTSSEHFSTTSEGSASSDDSL